MSSPKRGSLMDLPKRVELTRLEATRSVDELERTFLAEPGAEPSEEQPAGSPIDRTGERHAIQTSVPSRVRPSVLTDVQTDGRTSVEAHVSTDIYTPDYAISRAPPAIQPTITSTGQGREVPQDSLAARIRREPRGAVKIVGYKIPGDLKEELEAVARYNNSDMTRIVVEGIRLALAQLPHPPDWPHS